MKLNFAQLQKEGFWGLPLRHFSIINFMAEQIKIDRREPNPFGIHKGQWIKSKQERIRITLEHYDSVKGTFPVQITLTPVDVDMGSPDRVYAEVHIHRECSISKLATKAYTMTHSVIYDDQFANNLMKAVEETRNRFLNIWGEKWEQ